MASGIVTDRIYAARLVGEHRLNDAPLMVIEFISRGCQFGGLNHGRHATNNRSRHARSRPESRLVDFHCLDVSLRPYVGVHLHAEIGDTARKVIDSHALGRICRDGGGGHGG